MESFMSGSTIDSVHDSKYEAKEKPRGKTLCLDAPEEGPLVNKCKGINTTTQGSGLMWNQTTSPSRVVLSTQTSSSSPKSHQIIKV